MLPITKVEKKRSKEQNTDSRRKHPPLNLSITHNLTLQQELKDLQTFEPPIPSQDLPTRSRSSEVALSYLSASSSVCHSRRHFNPHPSFAPLSSLWPAFLPSFLGENPQSIAAFLSPLQSPTPNSADPRHFRLAVALNYICAYVLALCL